MNEMEFTRVPLAPNPLKDFPEFARTVTANQRELGLTLKRLIELQEQSNALLAQLVQGQQSKG